MARPIDPPAMPPRFVEGDTVRVLSLFPEKGHYRTPYYLRGKSGRVIRYFGLFYDPTGLAQGEAAPQICGLYQILFKHPEVWNTDTGCLSPHTNIVADLYDNWLETQ